MYKCPLLMVCSRNFHSFACYEYIHFAPSDEPRLPSCDFFIRPLMTFLLLLYLGPHTGRLISLIVVAKETVTLETCKPSISFGRVDQKK